jgi:flagellar basal-body rod modification protein FlgD
MTNISEIASSSLNTKSGSSVADPKELGQNEFLELMLTQMRHQDPFNPTDNGEFITQMAQFSQVSSTDAMRTSMEKFVQDQSSSQLLAAANLVGRKAMINGGTGNLGTDSPIQAEYTLTEATDSATALVTNQAGSVVYSMDLGTNSSGTHSLSWDGATSAGDQAPSGQYQIAIQYLNNKGESIAAPVAVEVNVESVKLGTDGSGLSMATKDGREIKISDVNKFL